MAFSPLATSHHFGHAGREAPFFQPPKSPASIATSPAYATADDRFGASRKRQRGASTHATYQAETPSWASQCPTPSDRIFGSAYGQDSCLVNEKYRLAGGFDTPSLEATSRLEPLTVNEHEFRRRLRDDGDDMGNTLRCDDAPIFGPLARERNGMPRISTGSDAGGPQKTWTNAAIGMVGRVFAFGTNVIKGFYAGGGDGYDLNHSSLVGSDLLQASASGDRTPIPGSWCQDEFLGDFEQDSPAFTTAQTPADRQTNKRRQLERDNWVVIGTPEIDDAMGRPSKRKTTTADMPRSNLAGKPTASRASSRRSLAPTPRRGTAPNGSPAQYHSSLSHNKRASMAPMRSPQGRPSMSGNGLSFITPEAEKYAKRQAKQDRAADKAMSSMGKQMEDLIKQAQEALGTKVSVEGGDGMEVGDEGYDDDDW